MRLDRQFLLLKGSQKLEEALLLTTIAEGLSPENWQKISRQEGTWGKILLIAGGDLVLAEDLVPPAGGSRRIFRPRLARPAVLTSFPNPPF